MRPRQRQRQAVRTGSMNCCRRLWWGGSEDAVQVGYEINSTLHYQSRHRLLSHGNVAPRLRSHTLADEKRSAKTEHVKGIENRRASEP